MLRLTQQKLAEKCGVHRSTVWQWEAGRIFPPLAKVCVALDITPRRLFVGVDYRPPPGPRGSHVPRTMEDWNALREKHFGPPQPPQPPPPPAPVPPPPAMSPEAQAAADALLDNLFPDRHWEQPGEPQTRATWPVDEEALKAAVDEKKPGHH